MAVVTPEDVAVRAGMSSTLTPVQRAVLQDAIDDALGAVTAHLHVSPTPQQYTEYGVVPNGDAWALSRHPVVQVISATPETAGGQPTGRYTVVYTAGLDPDADPAYRAALRRYVLGHAEQMPSVVQIRPAGRTVTSASLEGQSVSYEKAPQAGSGEAGAPPTLSSLDHWRILGVYQDPGIAPHPLGFSSWR